MLELLPPIVNKLDDWLETAVAVNGSKDDKVVVIDPLLLFMGTLLFIATVSPLLSDIGTSIGLVPCADDDIVAITSSIIFGCAPLCVALCVFCANTSVSPLAVSMDEEVLT